MRRLAVVSLFSGAGGLDLGFAQTGLYEVVFANDILAHAMRTYSRNFGLKLVACGGDKEVEASLGTALECDVERVDFTTLRDMEVDVVIGGPPCQDFSIVRGSEWDRRGIEVRRGRLYAHFVRALAALQPKAFLFENVPGLVSANRGLAYKVILEDLSNLNMRWSEVRKAAGGAGPAGPVEGYHIILSEVLDFSRFGVPQRRERLIIVGVRKDLVRGLEGLWRVRAAFMRSLKESAGLFPKYPLTAIEAFEGRRLDELGDAYREVMRKWDGVWLEVRSSSMTLYASPLLALTSPGTFSNRKAFGCRAASALTKCAYSLPRLTSMPLLSHSGPLTMEKSWQGGPPSSTSTSAPLRGVKSTRSTSHSSAVPGRASTFLSPSHATSFSPKFRE